MASGSPARLAFRSHSATSNAAMAWVASPLRPTEAPAQHELDPQLADVTGVLADQDVGDLLGVGELAGAAGPLGVGEADPLMTVLGRDLDEEERDLGHRLLPSGEHLGVADRGGQRQRDAGELQMGDPVHCGGAVGRHVGSFLSEVWASDS